VYWKIVEKPPALTKITFPPLINISPIIHIKNEKEIVTEIHSSANFLKL
jgi:hypothetical protein